MKLINKTNQKQAIHYITGEATAVMPGQSITIDKSKIYLSEMNRILSFFTIKDVVVKKKETQVESNIHIPSKKEEDKGGNR